MWEGYWVRVAAVIGGMAPLEPSKRWVSLVGDKEDDEEEAISMNFRVRPWWMWWQIWQWGSQRSQVKRQKWRVERCARVRFVWVEEEK
jgi:hypothetical protein